MIHLEQELLSVLDEEFGPDNRSEAIRRILRDWLIGHGYLKGE